MKKLTLILASILISILSFSQSDELYFYSDATFAFNPIRLTGIEDQGSGTVGQTVGGNLTYREPVYQKVEIQSSTVSIVGHIGMSVPFYQTDDWSVGAKVNVGLGFQFPAKNSDGLEGMVLSFPQFGYFRWVGKNFDYSALAGYKFTKGPINYHHFLLGFDWEIGEGDAIRIYGTPFRYKLYREYTNGELEPMFEVAEIGISYVVKF
ncbi:hypothetical protein [Halocola ammonii]